MNWYKKIFLVSTVLFLNLNGIYAARQKLFEMTSFTRASGDFDEAAEAEGCSQKSAACLTLIGVEKAFLSWCKTVDIRREFASESADEVYLEIVAGTAKMKYVFLGDRKSPEALHVTDFDIAAISSLRDLSLQDYKIFIKALDLIDISIAEKISKGTDECFNQFSRVMITVEGSSHSPSFNAAWVYLYKTNFLVDVRAALNERLEHDAVNARSIARMIHFIDEALPKFAILLGASSKRFK